MGWLCCQRLETDCRYLSANSCVKQHTQIDFRHALIYLWVCDKSFNCNFSNDVWGRWMHNKKVSQKVGCNFPLCWRCLGIDTHKHCTVGSTMCIYTYHYPLSFFIVDKRNGTTGMGRMQCFEENIFFCLMNLGMDNKLFFLLEMMYCNHVILLSCKSLNFCINIHEDINGMLSHVFFVHCTESSMPPYSKYILHTNSGYPYVMSQWKNWICKHAIISTTFLIRKHDLKQNIY